jgi:hypothetical protein
MATKAVNLARALKEQQSHNHICGFYTSEAERLRMLAAYYKIGLEREELCIFISDQNPVELTSALLEHGLDIRNAVASKKFMIFTVHPTYLPDDKFESMRMLTNLKNFVKVAHSKHFPAVRGGGDMNWIAEKPAGWQQVIDYEARINRFVRTNEFTGLCIFKAELLESEVVQQIIQTHQLIIKGGKLYTNPYYIPPESSFKFDLNLVAEIEKWLDRLDENESITAKA